MVVLVAKYGGFVEPGAREIRARSFAFVSLTSILGAPVINFGFVLGYGCCSNYSDKSMPRCLSFVLVNMAKKKIRRKFIKTDRIKLDRNAPMTIPELGLWDFIGS